MEGKERTRKAAVKDKRKIVKKKITKMKASVEGKGRTRETAGRYDLQDSHCDAYGGVAGGGPRW